MVFGYAVCLLVVYFDLGKLCCVLLVCCNMGFCLDVACLEVVVVLLLGRLVVFLWVVLLCFVGVRLV